MASFNPHYSFKSLQLHVMNVGTDRAA